MAECPTFIPNSTVKGLEALNKIRITDHGSHITDRRS